MIHLVTTYMPNRITDQPRYTGIRLPQQGFYPNSKDVLGEFGWYQVCTFCEVEAGNCSHTLEAA